jgi:beta-lactamase class A
MGSPGSRLARTCKESPKSLASILLAATILLLTCACSSLHHTMHFSLDYNTPADPQLQIQLERIDFTIRNALNIPPDAIAIGLYDLKTGRFAAIHPDREEYAASVAKIGILLAYFELNPSAATNLDPQTRHELGLMIKASDNEMAAKFSQQLGLHKIQAVLNRHGFYDPAHGGGLWVGKHYGVTGGERIGDPVGDNSHAATVRQLIRFYLMLAQDELISPAASGTMREIFASPEIPHDQIKFVKALADRNLTILRKWGSWEDWLHDSAIIEGPNRKYILVALTHHPRGDDYLEALAREVDQLMNTR